MIRHQNFEIPGEWAVSTLAGEWQDPAPVAGVWERPAQVAGVWRRIPGSVAIIGDPVPFLTADEEPFLTAGGAPFLVLP